MRLYRTRDQRLVEQKHVEPHQGAAPPMQCPNTVKHRPAFGGTTFGCLTRPSAAPGCGSTGLGSSRLAPDLTRPSAASGCGSTGLGSSRPAPHLTRPSAAPGCGSTGLGCSRPARTLAPDLIRPSAAPGCGSTGLGSSRWRRLGLERLLQNTRRAGARDAPARAFGVARTMLWASSCGPCGAVNYFTTLAVLMVPSA